MRRRAPKLDEVDREALQRAIELARAESPQRAEQIDNKLKHEPWFEVATFAAYCAQGHFLRLKLWQSPPLCVNEYAKYVDDDDEAAAEILRRLLAVGLSRYEPDPMTALDEAENKQQGNETRTGKSEVHRSH